VIVAVAFAAGLVAGLAAWFLLRPVFASPVLARENYRNHVLATAGGLAPVITYVVVVGFAHLALVRGHGGWDWEVRIGLAGLFMGTIVGFAFFGLLDDLVGVGESGGFKAHVRAMVGGRLTTGGIKLVGGAAVALAVVFGRSHGSVWRWLLDGALVALAANLGNLFDRAPGRTIKVGLVAFVLLFAGVGDADLLVGVAFFVGACVALLLPDLREEVMIGDTGANALGAVLGLGVVFTCAPVTRTIVLVVVLALNLASEVVSFSKVIDRVGPLRALDRLGRRPPS
jgi:hypothetical protein